MLMVISWNILSAPTNDFLIAGVLSPMPYRSGWRCLGEPGPINWKNWALLVAGVVTPWLPSSRGLQLDLHLQACQAKGQGEDTSAEKPNPL
jgi:hypothetical protein